MAQLKLGVLHKFLPILGGLIRLVREEKWITLKTG